MVDLKHSDRIDKKKKCVELVSNAKINLALDVLGKYEDGYHEVRMVMQLLELHDKVGVGIIYDGKPGISISGNKPYLPKDSRNLAYKAAMLMLDLFPEHKDDSIRIGIKKNIPVAAGLAGGSGNAAAVILALNHLWDTKMSLADMIEVSKPLGSDVPFLVMGTAATNPCLGLSEEKLAATCCEAVGKGDEIRPLPRFCSYVVLSKPAICVSTPNVYKALKIDEIEEHPDIDELIEGLIEKNHFKINKNMANALENVTLKEYSVVKYTKNKMKNLSYGMPVLMSGSGPTIYGIYNNKHKAEKVMAYMKELNDETYFTKTL